MTVTTKPDHREDHVISRNTIARGMPGVSGVTVVTTLVCFLFLHTRPRRVERPAFPAPSEFQMASSIAKLAWITRRDRGGVSLYDVTPCVVLANARTHNHRPCGWSKVFE
jgi:hypothetical protein